MISMLTIKTQNPHHLAQLPPIDVSEIGRLIYTHQNGELKAHPENWQRPPWTQAQWQDQLQHWADDLHWDVVLGAFDGERFAGMASLRYRLSGDMAQLTTLHVSQVYRRRGVARQLVGEIFRLAQESGATSIYVSATESESAVGFYLSQGFRPTSEPDQRLLEMEPDDIHMIKTF
jgi:ribosomal protein S18 acetylase RimI-like enzyme